MVASHLVVEAAARSETRPITREATWRRGSEEVRRNGRPLRSLPPGNRVWNKVPNPWGQWRRVKYRADSQEEGLPSLRSRWYDGTSTWGALLLAHPRPCRREKHQQPKLSIFLRLTRWANSQIAGGIKRRAPAVRDERSERQCGSFPITVNNNNTLGFVCACEP